MLSKTNLLAFIAFILMQTYSIFVQAIPNSAPAYEEGTILVVFKKSTTPQERYLASLSINNSLKLDAYKESSKNSVFIKDRVVQELALPRKANVMQAINKISQNPAVAYAEPNYIITLANTPNDPDYVKLWGLNNIGVKQGKTNADIDAPQGWDSTTGSSKIVVGVIDSGIDYTHPDLKQNLWTNSNEVPGNNVDDDGDGYIDDIHGIDAINNSGDPMDYNGHGTHVAGTIGAKGNNGIGIVGVNWDVRIISCKFIGSLGRGNIFDGIKCINYMKELKVKYGVNIVAINDSWIGSYSQVLEDSIEEAGKAGILSVAAAGNDNTDIDTRPVYPAAFQSDYLITVAATNRYDELWQNFYSGTNYGLKSVALGAPGAEILSTDLHHKYGVRSGTSMAAPHVTGAAALAWSWNPSLSVTEMKSLLMNNGDSIASLKGKTITGKRLNVNKVLAAVPGFSFKASPEHHQIIAGQSTSFLFDVRSIANWEGNITLQIQPDHELCCVNLSKPTVFVNNSVNDEFKLSVETSENTDWGKYKLAVSGKSSELKRSSNVFLDVLPVGVKEFPFSNTSPTTIPNKKHQNIVSNIDVNGDLQVVELNGYFDISHKSRDALKITLTSPKGTKVVIPNSVPIDVNGNQVESFHLLNFNREMARGTWKLTVTNNDDSATDEGTLNAWGITLSAIGDMEPTAPVAKFNYKIDKLDVSFINASFDYNYDIVNYLWDFGDGTTSTNADETHTYEKPGSYTITLEVEDNLGKQSTAVTNIEVFDHNINAKVAKSRITKKRKAIVKLKWLGAEGKYVGIYRDSKLINTVKNDDAFTDNIEDPYNSYNYKICETSSNLCSNPVRVSF